MKKEKGIPYAYSKCDLNSLLRPTQHHKGQGVEFYGSSHKKEHLCPCVVFLMRRHKEEHETKRANFTFFSRNKGLSFLPPEGIPPEQVIYV